jgi:predicted MFS family arabinose efflux permease
MFAIGVAFLVWEIVIIKRLTLLFGVPVLTFAVGLSLVLAASGLGGWYAGRPGCAPSFRRLVPALLAAAAWLLLAGPALTSLAGAALPVRFLAAVVFAAPPAFLMGMFFPSGLRRFGSGDPGGAPYYFAANGAASVLGAALTQLLALNFGYRVTTWVGGLLYLGCATLLRNAREEKG